MNVGFGPTTSTRRSCSRCVKRSHDARWRPTAVLPVPGPPCTTSAPSGSAVISRYWSDWIVATMSRMRTSRRRSSSSSRKSETLAPSTALPSSDSSEMSSGRLPVDDERLVLVVVHPAAADVERPRRAVEREASEDEPPLGILEGAHPPFGPCLHRERGILGRHRVLGARQRRPHAIELLVGAVDVGLLGTKLGVGHGRPKVPT